MKKECQTAKNRQACSCTYEPCSRKGICCECIAYHQRNSEIPGCLFPPEWEKKYDRSIAAFLKAHGA
ncbi:MAG: DUF6485 family protein [Verrucomicrobiae bacterium]|nr:DUF6485 family protein [Verrucomicrobiae bacterium]